MGNFHDETIKTEILGLSSSTGHAVHRADELVHLPCLWENEMQSIGSLCSKCSSLCMLTLPSEGI